MSKQRMPATLDLVRGNVVLGTIEVTKGQADPPWHNGIFKAAPGFEGVRDLFERELKLLQANTNNDSAQWDDWEAVHAELHEPGLRLEAGDKAYGDDEILIHIDGTQAWWRTE